MPKKIYITIINFTAATVKHKITLDTMSYAFPDAKEFIEELSHVTEWYQLGIHLGIPKHLLDRIERDHGSRGTERCMTEMHDALQMSNDQVGEIWDSIAAALEKMGKNRLASEIKSKHEKLTVSCRGQATPSSTDLAITVEERITNDFERLRNSLLDLEQQVKRKIKKKKILVHDVWRVVLEHCPIRELNEHSVDELFREMSRHYCFMNYHVLAELIKRFLTKSKKVNKQLESYERQLKELKESTSLKNLMEQIHERRLCQERQAIVKIKLQDYWGEVRIEKFEQICCKIFKLLYQYLAHIRVEQGCICVSWLLNEVHCSGAVETIQASKEVLDQIGVLSVTIGETKAFEGHSTQCEEMKTAMILAAEKGNPQAIDILITAGANLNTSLTNGHTPLLQSSAKGHYEVVQLLINAQANVNTASITGDTALLLASTNGHTTVVSLLLGAGANPNMSNKRGHTPLMMASDQGHMKIVKLLLEAKANVNATTTSSLETAIFRACERGHTKIVSLLIQAGADLNVYSKGQTPLMAASHNGHTEIVHHLKNRTNVNAKNMQHRTAVYQASLNGHAETVLSLVEAGADWSIPDKEGQTPLMIASSKGHTNVVDLLLKKGCNIDATDINGRSSVFKASQNGRVTIVSFLQKAGADLNSADNDGDTPLITATSRGHKEVVETLLNAPEVIIDAATKQCRTALHEASTNGHTTIASMLLEAGANPSISDTEGITPLIISSIKGFTKIVEKLLSRKNVLINHQAWDGCTALHCAVENGHTEIVQQLVNAGAKSIENNEGTTPLSLAKNREMIEIIIKANRKGLNLLSLPERDSGIYSPCSSIGGRGSRQFTDSLELPESPELKHHLL